MRFRTISAVAVAVLAAFCLSGCRTNVGVAATVGGDRITETTVDNFLEPTGPDSSAAAQAAQGQSLPPARVVVLEILIQEKLYENVFDERGGVPSDGKLASLHDRLAQGITGTGVEKAVRTFLSGAGITKDFVPVYVRYLELRGALAQRSKAQTLGQFNGFVRKSGGTVRVNPRYGTWNPTQLSLSTAKNSGVPAYLKLQPTAVPAS